MTVPNRSTCVYQAVHLAAAIVVVWAAVADAATRVALVSGDRSDAGKIIVALAQAQLGNDAHFEMLERDEIQRVLDEQKLSITGAIDATQVLALGKLVTVELFVVVETPPGMKSAPSVVIFDAQSGIRYWDASIPGGATELEKSAESLVQAVQGADRKRSRQAQGLHTVGVVTVRNADLPRSRDSLCDAVGFLVERSLPRSPDIAVLERKRLERVNEERSLPGSTPPTDLLASLSTVELEISRGANKNGLQATAFVKHATRDQAERVSVSVGDLNASSLAEALSQKLIECLHAAPAGATADRRVEARRFDGEAVHHYSHQRFADAVRAEEAAHALDPQNEDYAERLAIYLIRHATYLFCPSKLNVSQSGDRAWKDTIVEPAVLETLLAQAQRGVEINQQSKRRSAHHPPFNWPLSYLCDRLRGFRNASAPNVQRQVDEVLEVCRRRSLDYCEMWAQTADADPQQLDTYTSCVFMELKNIKSASIDTAQYADCMHRIVDRWLYVTGEWQPRFNKSDGGEQFNMLLQDFVGPQNWPWAVDEGEYAQRMGPLFGAMQQHARPLVRLYGRLGQIRSDVVLARETEQGGYARFAIEYRTLAQSVINSPEPWDPARTRHAVYEAWNAAISAIPGKDRRSFVTQELLEQCNFMISRHELFYKSLQQAFQQLDPRLSLEMIDRMLPTLDSPLCKENEVEKTRLRSFLQTTRESILMARPELATSPAKLPWTKASKVFDVMQHRELSDLVGTVFVDKILYGLCLQFEGDRSALRLVRVSLSGGIVELLAKADLEIPAKELAAHLRPRFVSAACTDGQAIYVATSGAGIVVFPLPAGNPRRIDIAHGLPSNRVGSVAELNGKLFAGFGDGYLVSYDLQSDRCDVIASSRRKQKLSPFDDGDVFRVPTLIADPDRQRVVFVIGKDLWQITPADGKITQVLDLVAVSRGRSEPKLKGSTIDWSSPRRGDRLLVSNVFHAIEIDLSHNIATEIHSPETGIFPTVPPHLVVNGSLWSGGSFARLSLDKREHQSLPSPDKRPVQFRATVCLELVANGRQLVAADAYAIWLLDLNEAQPQVGQAETGAGR